MQFFQKPLSKHQRLTLHRSHSTFSFDDPIKLNIQVLTASSHRRTPAERMALAKKLRNASMGKRKKRRAFRRKPPAKTTGGTEGGGDSNIGTGGATTPDMRSTGGSVCGSLYGGSSGMDGGISPLPPRKRQKNKALMSGVYGERPTFVQKPKSAPPPVVVTHRMKPKRVVTIDEGDRVVSVIPRRYQKSDIEKGHSMDSGGGDPKPIGGIRISARVKTCEDETEETRFYLETDTTFVPRKSRSRKGILHDAVMKVLRRRSQMGEEGTASQQLEVKATSSDTAEDGSLETGPPSSHIDEDAGRTDEGVGTVVREEIEPDFSLDFTTSSMNSVLVNRTLTPNFMLDTESKVLYFINLSMW